MYRSAPMNIYHEINKVDSIWNIEDKYYNLWRK